MGEWSFAGDVVGALDLILRNQSKSLANHFWSVMEGRLQRDLGIVQELGIEFHFGTTGAATKEVDCASLANHVHRPLPCQRTANGLDHYISTALLGRMRTHSADWVLDSCDLYDFVSSEALGIFHLLITLHDGDDSQSAELGHLHEHESDRASADDHDTIARLCVSLIQSMQYAC